LQVHEIHSQFTVSFLNNVNVSVPTPSERGDVHAYNINSSEWRTLAEMPIFGTSLGFSMVVFNGQIILCGGLQESTTVASCYRLVNPFDKNATWKNDIPDMPKGRFSSSMIVYDNQLLNIGGSKDFARFGTSDVYAWSEGEQHWRTLSNLSEEMAAFSAVLIPHFGINSNATSSTDVIETHVIHIVHHDETFLLTGTKLIKSHTIDKQMDFDWSSCGYANKLLYCIAKKRGGEDQTNQTYIYNTANGKVLS
jgi:N-acetylneuraminic acid mutarotase